MSSRCRGCVKSALDLPPLISLQTAIRSGRAPAAIEPAKELDDAANKASADTTSEQQRAYAVPIRIATSRRRWQQPLPARAALRRSLCVRGEPHEDQSVANSVRRRSVLQRLDELGETLDRCSVLVCSRCAKQMLSMLARRIA